MTDNLNEVEDDKCRNCGNELPDEAFKGVNESRGEFWGAPCHEFIITGYKCPFCGHEEEF